MIHDITLTLGPGLVEYPGDPVFARELIEDLARGDSCRFSKLSMGAHTGTHLDAPAHFLVGGRTLDQFAPYRFVLPALVIEVPHGDIDEIALMDAEIPPGGAVLFKTENSARGLLGEKVFHDDFAALNLEAAKVCEEAGASLVGIDYFSVERSGSHDHPVHHALLSRDILILEAADLREVPPGPYTLICLPLKIEAAEASPVRALLLSGEE